MIMYMHYVSRFVYLSLAYLDLVDPVQVDTLDSVVSRQRAGGGTSK